MERGAYLPPETGVDRSAAAENAAGHLIGVLASDASRVMPDLVAEARHVEPSEVGPDQPIRLHGAAPATSGWWAFLDQENAVASRAEPVCHGDTTSTAADNDVLVGLGCRTGRDRGARSLGRAWRRGGGRGSFTSGSRSGLGSGGGFRRRSWLSSGSGSGRSISFGGGVGGTAAGTTGSGSGSGRGRRSCAGSGRRCPGVVAAGLGNRLS